jgi:hypothetical protein
MEKERKKKERNQRQQIEVRPVEIENEGRKEGIIPFHKWNNNI